MNFLVPIVLFGWIPLVVLLFFILPPRVAFLTALIGGWLFLPIAGYQFPGIPDYDKTTATQLGIIIGTAIFVPNRLMKFRPSYWDIPIFTWTLCPFMSSVWNGYGPYDGLSACLHHVTVWLIPYILGRIFFTKNSDLDQLAVAIVLGGLIYVPLCVIEIRMSPQLHTWIYGYHQHDFGQSFRFGGWRPTVFMQHGLMVGLWMMSASLASLTLALFRPGLRLYTIKVGWLCLVISTTFVLCKSTGAIALWMAGASCVFGVYFSRSTILPLILALLTLLYPVCRAVNIPNSSTLVSVVNEYLGDERAMSLAFRFQQETKVLDLAKQNIVLGLGSWTTGQDQWWLLILKRQGIIALVCMLLVFTLPSLIFALYTPRQPSSIRFRSATLAMVLLSVLFCIDCFFNAMLNPVFIVATGASIGVMSNRMYRQSCCA